MKKLLLEVQKLELEIKKLSDSCPQKPSWFNKRISVPDEEKSPKQTIDKINSLISTKWELGEKISKKTKTLKKGDAVYYLELNTNKLKEAIVVSQGKYKDDYNDFSSFIRIKDTKYSWNQSKDSLVKK
jgi:hypothetical protein